MGTDGERFIPITLSYLSSTHIFDCEPPAKLYHYTDYGGATGIIESGSLWLTKLANLSDTHELRLAIDMFAGATNARARELDDPRQSDLLTQAAKAVRGTEKINIGAVSFCESGDLLSQWRAYSGDSGGIALEFHGSQLAALARPGEVSLLRCVYALDQKQIIVDSLVSLLLNVYDCVKDTIADDFEWERNRDELLGYFRSTFLQVAPVLKNAHFAEEKEWRLITTPISLYHERWEARINNQRAAEHYVFTYHDLSCEKRSALNGLVVGPQGDFEAVSSAFDTFAVKKRHKLPHLQPSSIPYRRV